MINVDAVIFASSGQMGAGVVIRDHNGSCLAACRDTYEEVIIPELAEAQALRERSSLPRRKASPKLSSVLSVYR